MLEIGFGSGADIGRVAVRVFKGSVADIDHSQEMVRMATARNRRVIAAGRVDFRQGLASDLPHDSNSFDVVFCINVAQSWDAPEIVAREIWRVLKPGGRVALAVQPRSEGATEATALMTGEKLVAALMAAGFLRVKLERRPLQPVSAVCALAVK
jgi:ubiquinone/menaquinone biosynthesis C-methylase UbiE